MSKLTIVEKLKGLYDLQRIDSQIDEIRILKGELPIEVSDLEDEIAGLQTRLDRLQSIVDGFDKEASGHHAKIEEAEALMARYQRQLDDVKNSREFEALTKELELQELDILLAQKKIREINLELDRNQIDINHVEARLEKKHKELETKRQELAQIIEKTEKDEEKLRKQSEKARKKIEERLIKAYDKIRTSYRNGLAVVKVERNACGGCFNQIPAQLQLEIAQAKKITACEHCGRILIDDHTAMAHTAEAAK